MRSLFPLVGIILVVAMPCLAQEGRDMIEEPSANPAQQLVNSEALRNTSTESPRDTLESLLESMEQFHDVLSTEGRTKDNSALLLWLEDRVLACLDLQQVAPALKRDLGMSMAVRVYEVIARVSLPPIEDIPDKEFLRSLSPDDRPTFWRLGDTPIEIIHITEGHNKGRWLVSDYTRQEMLDYYNLVKVLPYQPDYRQEFTRLYHFTPGWMLPGTIVKQLPEWAGYHFFEQTIWQWTLFLGAVGISIIVLSYIFSYFRRITEEMDVVSGRLLRMIPMLAIIVVDLFLDHFLDEHVYLTGEVLWITTVVFSFIRIFAAMAIVVSLGTVISAAIINTPRIKTRSIDAAMIRISCKTVAIFVASAIFLMHAAEIGFSPAALLTGAGITGIALALAAQDTIKNFFASIVLLTERPFQLADVVTMPDGQNTKGFIEDIGIRSTRIRLFDGTLVTVPNEQLVRSQIENVSQRPSIRCNGELRLTYETSSQKLEETLQIVHEILINQKGVAEDPEPQAHFVDFGEFAFIIRFSYWYAPADWHDSRIAAQQVNLEIVRRFADAGIKFGFPRRTVAFSSETGDPPLMNPSPAT